MGQPAYPAPYTTIQPRQPDATNPYLGSGVATATAIPGGATAYGSDQGLVDQGEGTHPVASNPLNIPGIAARNLLTSAGAPEPVRRVGEEAANIAFFPVPGGIAGRIGAGLGTALGQEAGSQAGVPNIPSSVPIVGGQNPLSFVGGALGPAATEGIAARNIVKPEDLAARQAAKAAELGISPEELQQTFAPVGTDYGQKMAEAPAVRANAAREAYNAGENNRQAAAIAENDFLNKSASELSGEPSVTDADLHGVPSEQPSSLPNDKWEALKAKSMSNEWGAAGLQEPATGAYRAAEGIENNPNATNMGDAARFGGEGGQPPRFGPGRGQGDDFSGGRPTPETPQSFVRNPTAWDQAMAVIRAPVRIALTGGHILRTGIGTTIMHPTESLPLLVDYAKGWVSADARQRMLTETAELPLVKGTGYAQLGDGTFLDVSTIKAENFRGSHDFVRPAAVDRLLNKIPILRSSSEAGMNYLSGLRDAVYNEEAQRAIRAGDGLKLNPDGTYSINTSYYKDMYDTISHNTGHGFSNGTPGEASALGIGPSAWLARFKSVADVVTKPGTVNPLGTGARSIAIRNLIGIAGFMAATDAIGQLTGARVYLPFNLGSIGATDVTNPYGVESKLFKVSSMAPSGAKTFYSGGSGYDSLFRIFANAAIDLRNNDQDSLLTHLNAYLKGQMGPVPENALQILLGPDALNLQGKVGQAFAKDWKGDFTTWQSLKTQAEKNAFADQWAPIAAKSIYDAVNAWGSQGALRAAPSLLGGEVQTLPPSQAFTQRMEKSGLSGPELEKVQQAAAPMFSHLDQMKAAGETVESMNQWQRDYLAQHPEVVAALRSGSYQAPLPTNIQPREFNGGSSGIQPRQYTGNDSSSITPRDFQQQYKQPKPFQPRNKQQVPVGAQ